MESGVAASYDRLAALVASRGTDSIEKGTTES